MHKSVHIYIAYNKLKNLLILKWSKSGGRENGILYSKKKDSLNLCTSMQIDMRSEKVKLQSIIQDGI